MQAWFWLADANCAIVSHMSPARSATMPGTHARQRLILLCVYVHLNIFIGQCKKSRSLIKTTRISGSQINWNASRRAPQNQSPSLEAAANRIYIQQYSFFLSLVVGLQFFGSWEYSGLIIFGSCWLLGELIKRSAINFISVYGNVSDFNCFAAGRKFCHFFAAVLNIFYKYTWRRLVRQRTGAARIRVCICSARQTGFLTARF